MVLRYRISLPGIKGFARVYNVNDSTTLYTLHKHLRADMEFPQDQLILFKGLNADGGVVARYGLFDLGSGTVDSVTLAETLKKGIASFVYFYDALNKKSVIVTFEGEVPDTMPVKAPTLVESKGPNPIEFENGYIAFEDLPDDQKHVPGDSEWEAAKEDHSDDEIIGKGGKDDDVDDDDEDDDSDEDEKDPDEDGTEIYDGSEELTL